MGESLSTAKEALRGAMDLLKGNRGEEFPEEELRDLVARTQFARSALVRNEKKIWLRTKKGREMLIEFEEASKTLLEILKTSLDFEVIEKSVVAIEMHGKKLEEEIRRRSMVVT